MSKVQLRAALVGGVLRRAGVMVLAVVALVVVAPTVASAATSFQRVGVFNEAFPDGLAAHQHRIAVNHAGGDVYVTDPVGDQVGVYAPNGTGADPLTTFGAGVVTDPFGIAIDQSNGDVYVSDADDVVKFSSDGAPTPTFTQDNTFTSPGVTGPLAFDQATNELLVADKATNTIRRYGTDGTPGVTFDGSAGTGSPGAFTGLQDVAVDSTGDIVVVDATGNPALNDGSVSRVERFASNGDWKATIGPVEQAATVGIRPADDSVIVSGDQNKVYSSGTPSLNLFAVDGTALGQPAVDPSLLYAVVTGIAVDDGPAGQMYVGTDNGDYLNGGDQYSYGNTSVQVYDTMVLPSAVVAAAGSVTATSATLQGAVDPDGVDATYHFEYGTDTSYGSSTPESAPLTGSGAEAASAAVTGLNPGTTYHYRLVATNANGSLASRDATVTTGPVAPTISAVRATATRVEARLKAKINPQGAATTYHFEYGTTVGYGTSTESHTIPVGSAPADVDVDGYISGLKPGTTYHYRAVATNTAGSTTGDDQTFTTANLPAQDSCPNAAIRTAQRANSLPDCRAYEMVSPTDKSLGVVAYPTGGQPPGSPLLYEPAQYVANVASTDGSTVAYSAYAAFADPTGSGISSYRATRGASGWTSKMWMAPSALPHPDLQTVNWLVKDVSADLSVGYLQTGQPFNRLDQDYDPAGFAAPLDVYRIDANAMSDWQSRPNGEVAATDPGNAVLAGHSADGRVTLFETREKLVPEAPDGANLYERVDGVTRLVGLDSDGDPISNCGSVFATHNVNLNGSGDPMSGGAYSPVQGAISPDGSRIYFTAPDLFGKVVSSDPSCQDPARLYLRDGDETIDVSASQRSTPDAPSDAIFQGASADGSKVYFLSQAALTNAATPGAGWTLYGYDVASRQLTLLTPAGDVGGVTDVSGDGSIVYYVQSGALKVAVNGVSRTIAAVGSASLTGRNPYISAAPDGRRLLFVVDSDPTDIGADGQQQAYIYDLDADRLTCISCSGAAGYAVGTMVLRHPGDNTDRIASATSRNLSDDGRTAAFETASSLVPEDDNDAPDVYVWHDGKLGLVSDGRDRYGSFLFDMSADGRDVFIATAASLVGWDSDNGDQDVYDVRIGGGFPEPPPAAAPCSGDVCQGMPAVSPVAPVVGSVTFAGIGNASAPSREPAPTVSVSKVKAVTGTAATLKVKVPGAGAITVSGASVGKATKKASNAATYAVRVALTTKARASLKKRRSLKVTVTVAFTAKAGKAVSKKVALTFKQPKAKRRAGGSGAGRASVKGGR